MSDTQEGISTHVVQGVTRVSISRETAPEPLRAEPPALRVDNGSFRMGTDGQVTQNGVTKTNLATARQPGESVMGSVRTSLGSQRIDSTSTVIAEGVEMKIATAETLGYIRRDAQGNYIDVQAPKGGIDPKGEAPSQLAPGANDSTSDGPEVLSQAVESEWDSMLSPVPQATFDAGAALASIAVADLSGDTWNKMATRVAQESGLEVDQAAALVDRGYAVHEAIVARSVASVGVSESDKAEFYRFLQTDKPQELTRATQALVNLRNTSQFKALAVEWKASKATAQLPFYRSQGFTNSYVDQATGELWVSRPGQGAVKASSL